MNFANHGKPRSVELNLCITSHDRVMFFVCGTQFKVVIPNPQACPTVDPISEIWSQVCFLNTVSFVLYVNTTQIVGGRIGRGNGNFRTTTSASLSGAAHKAWVGRRRKIFSSSRGEPGYIKSHMALLTTLRICNILVDSEKHVAAAYGVGLL